jgi:hypothetical protein
VQYQKKKEIKKAILKKEKSILFLLHFFAKIYFSSLNRKTGQITSLNFSNCAFYLPGVILKVVLSLLFIYFG